MSRLHTIVLAACLGACGGVDYAHPPPAPDSLEGLQAGEPVVFTPDDDLLPSVSKDGRYVLFVSEQNGNLDVWVRDYLRDSIFPITKSSSADDYDPKISPEGDRMVFVTRRLDAKGDIFISDANNESDLERLTDDTTRDRQPVWSTDTRFVYFTTARGLGRESIARIDRDTKAITKVSPGYGFDPAVAPDGRYLVYTEPPVAGAAAYPHLTVLRLADGSTRALTLGEAPEGFAAFVPTAYLDDPLRAGIVYVRFPDDDTGEGVLDADDRASVWRIDVDLAARFDGDAPLPVPFPLTDGNDDELFPTADDGWLYVTKGQKQQDIVRYPITGMFPRYADPAAYLELAQTVDDPRTRWFILRLLRARAPPGSLLAAQAALRIANIHLDRGRPDLARMAFVELRAETDGAADRSPEAQLGGLAQVELIAIDHDQRLNDAAAEKRGDVIAETETALTTLSTKYAWAGRVVARIDLEQAELLMDRGERVRAIEALDRVTTEHADQTFAAARASLRRIELLGIAHDVAAIGEAYRRVVDRFPSQREVVREASRRIVETHVADLGVQNSWTDMVDALRRIVPRYGDSPVRLEARWRLARLLETQGALDPAALEYQQILAESADDRLGAARALVALADVHEARGHWDEAAEGWRQLRAGYGDLPGFGQRARDAITRVNLVRAAVEEADGDPADAMAAYRSVIDNDVTQIKAHRRFLALAAQTGTLEDALDEAKRRAERSASTPVARYAYGLALTWKEPPDLDAATEEIDAAIRLNPQLAAAYVTRGWIREMRERNPGVVATITQTLLATVGNMIGGLLNVEIGKRGELELAIEDYKTALRLNPESVDRELEAEILLNLGNAHYGLGQTTADVSNMRLAFERYVEVQNLGYTFHSPITEALYWERLGRSAVWAEEPVISAMATRRAIGFARRAGLSSRLAQLQGNLSLAYANAGEEAYARAALDTFGEALREGGEEERLIIAVRDRARARLGTLDERTTKNIDRSLEELATSRQILAEEGKTPRGKTPDLWRGAIANHSSAQYGFRPIAELGLNLALAEIAHEALGERSRVEALRRQRVAITQEVIDSSPSILLGVGDAEPVALLQVRERIGLLTTDARRVLIDGDLKQAAATFQAALDELESWRTDERVSADVGALAADRARLVAAMVEADLPIQHPTDVDLGAYVEAVYTDVAKDLTPTKSATAGTELLENEVLVRLPTAITSTGSLARTSSIAIGVPQLSASLLDARAAQARLRHADGLRRLRTVLRAKREGSDLAALLNELDASTSLLEQARTAFEAAVWRAAGAGLGRGGPILVTSMMGVADTTALIGDRPNFVPVLRAEARRIATMIGRPDLDVLVRFSEVSSQTATTAALLDTALRERGPHTYRSMRPVYESLLARTASAAVASGRTVDAIGAIDRWLMLRQSAATAEEIDDVSASEDLEAVRRYQRMLAELEELRRQLARSDVSLSVDDYQNILARIEGTMTALADFEELAPAELSELALARLFNVPQTPDVLPFELTPRQIMVAPVPIDGRLHLAVVDGSTTAEQLVVVSTDFTMDDVRAVYRTLWETLERGTTDQRAAAELRAALVDPIASRLEGKRDVIWASALIGGPIPGVVLGDRDISVSHVGALSTLGLVQRRQLVGVEGMVVVEGEQVPSLRPGGTRLSWDEALSFRNGSNEAPLAFGASRALDARSAYDRYAARAVRTVLVEAPLYIEPYAPVRSAIRLRTARQEEGELTSMTADVFQDELPLAALDIPAQTLILASVSKNTLGGAAETPTSTWLSLDLALAPKGFATTIVIPEVVPRQSAERVLAAYFEHAKLRSPAGALARAIGDERSRDPRVDLITLVGTPGLDDDATKLFAKKQLRAARSYAIDRLKKAKYREAAHALERWVRLQIEAEETKYIGSAYLALVGVLGDRLSEHARAADAMERHVKYLEATSKNQKKNADATADLAYLYSRAQDYDKAEATFKRAIERLQELGSEEGVARAWFKFARHYREKLDFENAAQFMERSIGKYEALGAYKKVKGRPKEADLALVQVGDIYLNSLSDPLRARRAYKRAARYARTEEARIDVTIDLARVARRRGDFDRAASLAEQARAAAKARSLATREMSGVVEAANVAWYRGDYQLGQTLCADSLALASQMYAAITKQRASKKKGVKVPSKKSVKQLEIYARSVCGLVAMSLRDFDAASQHLVLARRIAESINREREVATQFNNLGRVFLEFGRRQDAIDAFRSALAIDTKLGDRYALAYDLRNLGHALSLEGSHQEAREALDRGLDYAITAKDTNNELRARFALAELERSVGAVQESAEAYRRALPLAEKLGVRDLETRIHVALGQFHREQGDAAAAERALRAATKIARSMTGRVTETELAPSRLMAFDELMSLLLDQKRNEEAFEVATLAMSLEQVTLLDDARVPLPDSSVPALLDRVRTAVTATGAADALATLEQRAPRMAEMVEPVRVQDVVGEVPNDAGVIFYRLTQRELVTFVLADGALTVARVDAKDGRLREDVVRYAERLVARADLAVDHARLSATLLTPIAATITNKKRLAFVMSGPLAYVAVAALPFQGLETDGMLQVVDRFVLTRGLNVRAALRGLRSPMPAIAELPIHAFGAASIAPGATERPLPFADKELDVIHEEFPSAIVVRRDQVTKARLLAGLSAARGVIHFAGHTFYGNQRQTVFDPLGGRLRTSDGGVSVVDLMGIESHAQLVVLSACFSLLRPYETLTGVQSVAGEEIVSFAHAMQLAGAQNVLATTAFVDDLSAALVMKQFYRAAKTRDAPAALQAAQRAVRRLHPHPAWWATFSITTR